MFNRNKKDNWLTRLIDSDEIKFWTKDDLLGYEIKFDTEFEMVNQVFYSRNKRKFLSKYYNLLSPCLDTWYINLTHSTYKPELGSKSFTINKANTITINDFKIFYFEAFNFERKSVIIKIVSSNGFTSYNEYDIDSDMFNFFQHNYESKQRYLQSLIEKYNK